MREQAVKMVSDGTGDERIGSKDDSRQYRRDERTGSKDGGRRYRR